MKLSIITVNLNNVTGLKKTIKSVADQTDKDFEFIIIDGESTDGSFEVVQQFNNSTIQQFKWIREKDTGIFNAMNKGIKMSSGEYLLFLNSGDFLFSNEVLSDIFSNKKFTEDFICARCAISNNGKVEFITTPPQEFTFHDFFVTTLAHQSTFIKKELFDKYGYYREDLRLKSDWEFFVRTIILNKCTTTTVETILVDFNLDGVSSSSENRAKQQEEMNMIFDETVLSRIIPDYITYSNIVEEMKPYFWVKKKSFLNAFVLFAYKLAKNISRK